MNFRFLLLFSAVSVSAAHLTLAAQQSPAQNPHGAQAPSAPPQAAPVIRFEDASDKAGINFTHSYGSRQMASLLEDTGAGCVWFDYNNSGLESLYVLNGRPLDDSMHPFPLKVKPNPLPVSYTHLDVYKRQLWQRRSAS